MFRNLVSQLLISVIFEENNHILRTQKIRGGKVLKTFDKSFEDKKKLLKYVDSLSQNVQIYYTSAFFDASEQGLVPVSSASELEKFGISPKNTRILSLQNAQIYAPQASIYQYERLFEDYGELDLLFSPFMLLYHCIDTKIKPKKDKNSLFVFRHSNYLAMMICENKRVNFGKFFDLSVKDEVNLDEEIDFDAVPNEDESEAGEAINGLIREDAASTEKIKKEAQEEAASLAENISDNPLDIKPQPPQDAGAALDESKHIASSALDLSSFGGDMNMCACIFEGVQEFYTNPLYNGKFIDELVFFDSANISQAVLDYVEGEVFIKPEVVKIDTLNLMNELMRRELEI